MYNINIFVATLEWGKRDCMYMPLWNGVKERCT